MSEQNYRLTPVGRLVSGHPFESGDKDMEGRPLTNAQGQPRVEYFFAIAISKSDPGWADFWGWVYQIGAAGFPGGEYQQPTFAWKIVDGDAPNNAQKEGYAGHWVVKMKGGFQPKVFQQQNGQYVEILDKTAIKRGDYIRVNVNVAPNGNRTKPGVYINPGMVELVGYGPEIVTGPSAGDVFGGAPVAQLPPGASATPVAGSAPPPAQPGVPAGAPVPPQQAPAPAAPAAAPGAVPPTAPAAPSAPPAMAAPAAPAAAPVPGQAVPTPGFLNPGQQ